MTTNPIKTGELADSETLWNYPLGTLWKNQAQTIFNQAYIGFNSKLNVATGVPNLKNVKYDVFISDTMTESNMLYEPNNDYYFGPVGLDPETDFEGFDEFPTGSTDTNKWDITITPANFGSGSVSNVSNQLKITGNKGGSVSGSVSITVISKEEIFSTQMSNYIMLRIGGVTTTGDLGSAYLSMGGTTLYTTSVADTNEYYIEILNVGGRILWRRWIVGESAGSFNNISYGSGTKLTFGLSHSGGSGGATTSSFYAEFVRYYDFTTPNPLTCSITSAGVSEAITDLIATANASPDCTIEVTSDDTNYEEATDSEIHRFTNTGSTFKIKLGYENFTNYDDFVKISEYACLTNIGAE